jgi:hypothetical protein
MGGIRLIDKICNRCKKDYKGIHNQHLCNNCKDDGFDRKCKYCNITFITKFRYANHCEDCKTNLVWKRGKFPERGDLISKAKKEFFQTDLGKITAANVGTINSVKMKRYLKSEEGKRSLRLRAEKLSSLMKAKIASGEFTPKITNTFTHWNAVIDTGIERKKFRSSWEACVWFSNQHFQYEKIRIPYIGSDLKEHIYIVDFFDERNKILYELKPSCRIKDSMLKILAAEKFCIENNLQFILLSEKDLINYITPEIFTGINKKQLEKCLK